MTHGEGGNYFNWSAEWGLLVWPFTVTMIVVCYVYSSSEGFTAFKINKTRSLNESTKNISLQIYKNWTDL